MGLLSKAWKGIKKGFKKIGKAIKRGFKKFGKFMGKIGIVGQLAMMFILPGIGSAMMQGMMKGLGSLGTSLSAASNPLLQGAGAVLNGAHKFATSAGRIFRTVTDGDMDFGKTQLNRIPNVDLQLSGSGTWLENARVNVKSIGDPWRKAITGQGRTLLDISKSSGVSVEKLGEINPTLVEGVEPKNWGDIVTGKEARIYTKLPEPRPVAPSVDPSVDQGIIEGTYDRALAAGRADGSIPQATLPGEGAATRDIYGPAGTTAALPSEGEVLWKKPPTTPATPTHSSLLTQEQAAYDKMVADARADGRVPQDTPTSPVDAELDLASTAPGSDKWLSSIYKGARDELGDMFSFKKPITSVQTGMALAAQFSTPEEIEPPFYSAGIPDIQQFSPQHFEPMDTISVPFLQQLEREYGPWGWPAHLDNQLSYQQRMAASYPQPMAPYQSG
jgi:hypothetical protein